MIRGLIFKFFFYTGTFLICIIFIPALILPTKIMLIGGKILGYWIKFCLFFFLSVNIKITGKKISKKIRAFLLHLFINLYLKHFFYKQFLILQFYPKKRVITIPVFGWHLKKIGSISINRDKISKDNYGFYDKIINITNNTKRPVIIFPQATRTSPDEKIPFKKGVSKIYEKLNFICVPVALNSGDVWPKNGSLKSNKTIRVSIINSIPSGLKTEDFLKKIQENLYNELDKIR